MSKNKDDKYTREGDDCSQVRNIINQLNSDTPSREKSREVVMRADGTKVVRVTKKRRVMVSKDEKNRRSRKKLLVSLLAFLILMGCFAAYFFFSMSSMCSASYLDEKKQELCAAWGASSVEFKNPRVEGMTLVIDSVVARFPESSMLESVELVGINAPLDMSTFFSGEFRADHLKVRRADVRVYRNCGNLQLPTWVGENSIFRIKTYSCDNFNLYVGSPDNSTIAIKEANLQVHKSAGSKVVTMSKGKLALPGIGNEPRANGQYEFSILDGKLFITSAAIEDIILNCRDPKNVTAEQVKEQEELAKTMGAKQLQTADFVLKGRIADGASLYGPYSLDITRMPFKLISHGMFEQVLAAGEAYTSPSAEQSVSLTLSSNGKPSVFTGRVQLRNASVRESVGLKAKSIYEKNIVSSLKKSNYKVPVSFPQSSVNLLSDGSKYVLQIDELAMVQTDPADMRITARVEVEMNSANGQWNDLPISGNINYSLPKSVLNSRYENDAIDPVFAEDPNDRFRSVLMTQLSGTAAAPEDNSEELEASKEEERKLLKLRSSVDINQYVDAIKTEEAENPLPAIEPVTTESKEKTESDDDIFGKKKDDNAIFNESIIDQVPGVKPKEQGATVPVDPSVSF